MNTLAVLIDDDPDDIEFLKETINSIDQSIACIGYANPAEAINSLQTDLVLLPSFIFIDFNMPQMNGEECLLQLLTIDGLENTKLIVNSTHMPPHLSKHLKSRGAFEAYQKPPQVTALADIVREIILS